MSGRESRKSRVIAIGGPTAAGKTALAIAVALHYGTEIISADSRQFYREMRIGNARPSPEELASVPHHFIADRSLTTPLSAGQFAEEAMGRLETLFDRHAVVVVVGGSGLYLRALCDGIDEFPPVTAAARQRVADLSARGGLAELQTALQEADPAYFAVVDRQNARRLERALRVCYSADLPYSNYLGQRPQRPFTVGRYALAPQRADLYAKIERRVERMLAEGLEEEARGLLGYRELSVLQTVGYQEWWPYFEGDYTRERAVELIKRNTRRYAKRQYTYFRTTPTIEGAQNIIAKEGRF